MFLFNLFAALLCLLAECWVGAGPERLELSPCWVGRVGTGYEEMQVVRKLGIYMVLLWLPPFSCRVLNFKVSCAAVNSSLNSTFHERADILML